MTAHTVRQFETSSGAAVFQIPLRLFSGWGGLSGLDGFVYLALVDGNGGPFRVLIDAGSGLGESNPSLEDGLRQVGELLGRSFTLADLTHVLITHGHIDHYGGLPYIRERSAARIGVHELDLRILTHYEERLAIVARRLRDFLVEAGLPPDQCARLLDMYRITKSVYHSTPVDFTFEAVGMHLGPFQMLHVPGHCAGHVVIRLDDILFSGDHVLQDTSPHQSPEHLTLSTGLDHYLKSLAALEDWVRLPTRRPVIEGKAFATGLEETTSDGIRLTLGGHKEPIIDLPARIQAIRELHADRLEKTLAYLRQPHTIREVSTALFGETRGYNVLLALEEAGAHVEYLVQRGRLGIANLDELEAATAPIPLRYRCLDCQA